MIWLSGGVSHVDTWDLKPKAPLEYRGEFHPIATSSPAIALCEHLPLMARQAHHLAIVRSLGHYGRGTGDHHAGYYYNLTGHAPDPSFRALLNARTPQPDDWPFLGCVVGLKKPPHPELPSTITLPQKPGAPEYTRPGQFAARLGLEHDPMYVLGDRAKPLEFATPTLALEGGMTAARLTERRGLLSAVDSAIATFERVSASSDYSKHQNRAFDLLGSAHARRAFALDRESPRTVDRYGKTVNGLSFLLARRLAEAEVPFISVFWNEDPALNDLCKSGGGWDTHGNNFGCLKDRLLPEFDRAFSALLGDLDERGLLDQTLVYVTSEMGRNPRIGDPRSGGPKGAGRDHWTNCMSVVMAGGGIHGGQVYGTSDRYGAYPADHPVAPEDIAKTVYLAAGVTDTLVTDREGRPVNLLAEGRPLTSLFG